MRTLLVLTQFQRLFCCAVVLVFALMAACPFVEAVIPVEPSPTYQVGASGGYQVMLRLEGSTAAAAAPIIIEFTVKNMGQKELFYYCQDFEELFEIIVKDEHGGDVPLTSYGKYQRAVLSGAYKGGDVHGGILKPGESVKYRVLMNQEYDMSIPGTYTITPRFVAHDFPVPRKGKAPLIVLCKPMKVQVDSFDGGPVNGAMKSGNPSSPN